VSIYSEGIQSSGGIRRVNMASNNFFHAIGMSEPAMIQAFPNF